MLITGATVLTLDRANRVIHDGAVLIRGGLIEAVGKTATLTRKHRREKVTDAHGMILMPGLINAHMHLYSTFARGMAIPGRPPVNFDQILQRLWWKLDKALRPEDLRPSALVPLLGGIRAGTTTVIDHHASPNAIPASLDTLAEAARDAGVRTALCYEVSDRDGQAVADQGIVENVRFLERVRREKSPMLGGLFGLHAQFTVGDDTLRRSVEAADALGFGVHIHCAEGFTDLANARQRHAVTAVERLHGAGALGPGTILAHCIHVNADDRRRIAQTDTFVSHQPRSNMNNAVGTMDLRAMRKARVNLAIGTDGMSNNMFDEVRTCHLLHANDTRDPRVGFAEACQILLDGNRELAQRILDVKIGRIAKGHVADLILLDHHPPTPLKSDNLFGHLLFGLGDAPVDSTMVNGRWLMRRRTLLHRKIDESALADESQRRARALWRRL
jgi:putative selenium metabolism protein SsnA